MPFVQAQLDKLDEAIATGARAVQYGDRTITYNSLEEMIDLRNLMAGEIAGAVVAGETPRSRHHYVYSSKGF